jgi:hypothetical protein
MTWTHWAARLARSEVSERRDRDGKETVETLDSAVYVKMEVGRVE